MRLDSIPFPWEQFRRQTKGWSKELIGTLLVLWIEQWADGGIPADSSVALSRALGESRVEAKRLWSLLKRRFTRGDDGLYRDPELEAIRAAEIEELARWTDHGRRGAEARWKGHQGKRPVSSNYRRAVRIAHDIMDRQPHAKWPEWVEQFKTVAGQQGIDFMERGGASKSPLYMRALEYVEGVKKRRKERGEQPWKQSRKAKR